MTTAQLIWATAVATPVGAVVAAVVFIAARKLLRYWLKPD